MGDDGKYHDVGVIASVTEDADSWSSIVASVSVGGEEDGRWYVAREFHMGKDS